MSSLPKEYFIDRNYIFKNPFEEIKSLLNENEKVKIVTLPKYVPIAFQVVKELSDEGIAIYDEELKVERFFKDKKLKTRIYLSVKRKQELNQFLIGENYFYKNTFEEVKNYLRNHDKVTIVAKTGEVGIAFRVAKELVSQGIAQYNEELKLGRNFKAGKGNTQVYVSLKKRPNIKEYNIKKDIELSKIVNDIKELFEKNERITITALPSEVTRAFKVTKTLVDEEIASYDEDLKIKRNFKSSKEKTKVLISLRRRQISPQLNIINTKVIQKNFNSEGLWRSTKNIFEKKDLEKQYTEFHRPMGIKKGEIKEYIVDKKSTPGKIIEDLIELFKLNEKIKLVVLRDKVGDSFSAIHTLFKKGIAVYDEELKIIQNFKKKNRNTKVFISIRKKKTE